MLGGIIGGIIGNSEQRKAINASQDAQNAAYNEAKKLLGNPELVKQLELEELLVGDQLNPYLIQPTDVGASEMEGVDYDSGLRDAQMSALEMLRQRSVTGLGPEDRAALNQVRGEVQRDTEAKRQQILQQMQARGLGGSGAELAMQIAGSQQSADQASAEADRLAAMASQNALSALAQYGNQAGNLQAQDLGLQSSKAQAMDEFNRFNIQGRRDAQATNVGAQNQAQAANIGRSNTVSDTNIGNRNQELANVRDLKNQQAANMSNLAVGQGATNAATQKALGQNRAALATGIGGAFDEAGAKVIGAMTGNPSAATGSGRGKSGYGDTLAMSDGGIVPGEAEVEADHPVNDKVNVMLSPGEAVIPKSVMKHKDPEVVMAFVKGLLAKK